jgi:hypothetical protein
MTSQQIAGLGDTSCNINGFESPLRREIQPQFRRT